MAAPAEELAAVDGRRADHRRRRSPRGSRWTPTGRSSRSCGPPASTSACPCERGAERRRRSLAGKAVVVTGTLDGYPRGGRGGDLGPRRQEPRQRQREDVRPRRRRQPRRQQGHQGRERRRPDPRRGRLRARCSRPASCPTTAFVPSVRSTTWRARDASSRSDDGEGPGVGAGRASALERPPVDDLHGVGAGVERRRSASSSPGVNVSVALPGSKTTPGGTSICSPGSTSTGAELVEADRRQRDAVDRPAGPRSPRRGRRRPASAASTWTASGAGVMLLDRRRAGSVTSSPVTDAGQRRSRSARGRRR